MNAPRTRLKGFFSGLVISIGMLPAVWSVDVSANLSGATMATFASNPITTVQSATPLVMLAMSRDHQLFEKAYNDFSDLDGDGNIERTYSDAFTYYGYFHAERCYTYNDTNKVFSVAGVAGGTHNHYCEGSLDNAWSGNFLNWATMTRIDIVRKILYGGYRSTDTATATVLERAHIPTDGHSFAKYYNGADLAKLVPYAVGATQSASTPLVVEATSTSGNTVGRDDINEGITICNATPDASTTASSQSTTAPPLMRAVAGNYQLWAANERWQCTWNDEPDSSHDKSGANSNANNSGYSGIYAATSDPGTTQALKTPGASRDHVVRIKVCENNSFYSSTRNLENCSVYGSNLKPEGLLQRYGLKNQINFGLVTGSYQKNISGGVLRKNVGGILDEVSTADGTFLNPSPATPSIIGTLNKLRVFGYGYKNGSYLGTLMTSPSADNGGDTCNWQLTDIKAPDGPGEGKCASWGNPFSEIYLEAIRYFAVSGTRAATAAFSANDSTYISGLMTDSWATNPLTDSNACASLNIVAFDASVSSYDDDQTNSYAAVNPVTTTKAVGDGEAITNNSYFVGRTAANTNELCTAKTVTDLGASYGLCPEAPTVRGSYHMAGLAHWAHTHDIRADLTGTQSIRTFAVALATNVPTIKIPIGAVGSATRFVNVLPAYRYLKVAADPTKDGGGTLMDFKIVQPHVEVANMTATTAGSSAGRYWYGKFYVNWEDSEQGGDFDQDVWGVLEYHVDATSNQVKITTTAVSESTGGAQLFGFITSGTTQDGFHAYSGVINASYTDPTGVTGCLHCRALPGSTFADTPAAGEVSQTGAQSYTFTVSSTGAASALQSPLYYAAKWGGFDDKNGNNVPDLREEWDVKDTNGNDSTTGDGIPDNYFYVTNPSALEDALITVFNRIVERVSSGTAAAVVANSQEGVGALYQALYDPIKKDDTDAKNEAQWIGTLHALWVDPYGHLREDSDTAGTKGKLDGYDVDKVVNVFFDSVDRRTKVRHWTSSSATVFTPASSTVGELSTLKPIWNARERLASLDDTTITSQRPYDHTADTGRYIFTWMDNNFDNVPDTGGTTSEVIDFVSTNITSSNFRWLDANDLASAQALVDWVRGKSGLTQFRSRVVDYDGDGSATITTTNASTGSTTTTPEVMRLGDIIDSSPVAVARPVDNYDQISQDTSYATFRSQYLNRREVVYVGANDGMIHAFNAGFYDATTREYKLQLNGETQHPLGSEIWAYVPKNLLPHLQWMARKDYSHVYYADLTPRVFDAKIFTADTDHPGGWGTLLVVGMRFGGGTDSTGITVDVQGDGLGSANTDGNANDDVKTKSAYVILDVTNPEVAPKVLGEISPPNLQFSTSQPAVIPLNNPTGSSPNSWYLVFGTGPSDIGTASYDSGLSPNQRFAQLFVYDLRNLTDTTAASLNGLKKTFTLNETNVFIGDSKVTDYNLNEKAEAIYFGTVGKPDDLATNQGSFYRVSIGETTDTDSWVAPFKLLTNANKPFVHEASYTVDNNLNHWVFAGSGRLYVNQDKSTDSTQTFYGFIDPNPNTNTAGTGPSTTTIQVNATNLTDVSGYRVLSNGDIYTSGTISGSANTTFKGLQVTTLAAGGWKKNMQNPATSQSERNINRMSLIGGVLFATAYTPSTNVCSQDGTSRLYDMFYKNGVSAPEGPLGTQACASCPTGVVEAVPSIDLGYGIASSPAIHITSNLNPSNTSGTGSSSSSGTTSGSTSGSTSGTSTSSSGSSSGTGTSSGGFGASSSSGTSSGSGSSSTSSSTSGSSSGAPYGSSSGAACGTTSTAGMGSTQGATGAITGSGGNIIEAQLKVGSGVNSCEISWREHRGAE